MGLFSSPSKFSGKKTGRMEGEKIIGKISDYGTRQKLKPYLKEIGTGKISIDELTKKINREHGEFAKKRFEKAAESHYGLDKKNELSSKPKKISLDEQARLRKVAEVKAKMNVAVRRRFDLAQEERQYKESKGGLRDDALQGGNFAGVGGQHSVGIGGASQNSTVSTGMNTPNQTQIPSKPSMLGRIGGFMNPFKR